MRMKRKPCINGKHHFHICQIADIAIVKKSRCENSAIMWNIMFHGNHAAIAVCDGGKHCVNNKVTSLHAITLCMRHYKNIAELKDYRYNSLLHAF